jgi:hypothetical protein
VGRILVAPANTLISEEAMTWSSFEGVVNSGTREAWLGETAGTIGPKSRRRRRRNA